MYYRKPYEDNNCSIILFTISSNFIGGLVDGAQMMSLVQKVTSEHYANSVQYQRIRIIYMQEVDNFNVVHVPIYR